MTFIAHARNPGKDTSPSIGLPLFDWRPSLPLYSNALHVVARRLSVRCRVPFHVALAHAEQAGLGKEAF